MSIVQAIVLGIVQGLTEFIPVSSTAHLILVEKALGWNFGTEIDFAFNVLIQLGTSVALVVYFWKDLWHIARAVIDALRQRAPLATSDARLGWLVVVATIPALIIGLLFKNFFEALHEQPVVVALVLILASALLFLGERIGQRVRALVTATWLDAIVIGCAQALALVPGVSRSGATISAALAREFERTAAARLSFLMSVPALIGAGVLAARDLARTPSLGVVLLPLAVGSIVAGIVGFLSIHWLLRYLSRHPLYVFGGYRVLAGIIFLALLLLRR
jgi:undecaprenyl-diphosphatase